MIDLVLDFCKNKTNVSDFHLRAGNNFAYRESGKIKIVKDKLITSDDLESLLLNNCSKEQQEEFKKNLELDCAIILESIRLRANFYKNSNSTSVVLRKVETTPPTMQELNLPPVLYNLIDAKKGLVLLTGPTGSGKTTTLASIINEINVNRACNIITIEDPIEFIHKDNQSIISQREVGRDTKSFSAALKAALREDPDVILVGELRDLETISLALTAAETGHLVFGTLHTSGAPNTINRIIDVFNPSQQAQVRAQVSDSLLMVVTQNLLLQKDKDSRIAAFEVLVSTPPVRNLIRENKIHQLPSVIQTSQKDGMITMEKSLETLVAKGLLENGKE